MHAAHTAEEGLDRILALRADDLDGWEEEAASALDPAERGATEALDATFGDLLRVWTESDDGLEEPHISASDFVGLPQEAAAVYATPRIRTPAAQSTRSRPGTWAPAALAACLAICAFAIWQLAPGPSTPEDLGLKAISGESAARLDFQFSVERDLGDHILVEPGRDGAAYGAQDHLAMRLQVSGAGGWLYILEVDPSGEPTLLHPSDGNGLQVGPGGHMLRDAAGDIMVYQPETLGSALRYVAIVTDEPSDAVSLTRGVLTAGLDRSDSWPARVRAVDSFAVDWEATP